MLSNDVCTKLVSTRLSITMRGAPVKSSLASNLQWRQQLIQNILWNCTHHFDKEVILEADSYRCLSIKEIENEIIKKKLTKKTAGFQFGRL